MQSTTTSRIKRLVKHFLRIKEPAIVEWVGDYSDWSVASAVSEGYDAEEIASKMIQSVRDVLDGSATYCRDGVTFRTGEFNWQLVTFVERLALAVGRSINVLDFGGAFGDGYLQNRSMVDEYVASWTVVEQASLLRQAKTLPYVPKLTFQDSIGACQVPIDLVIVSSVLQYIADYQKVIDGLVGLRSRGIFVDRTGFVPDDQSVNRITKQFVRKPIYDASYPCYFFSKRNFVPLFKPYIPIAEWRTSDCANIPSQFLGMYFEAPRS
jgi:putative methyltransferase (TIGR04325 family)